MGFQHLAHVHTAGHPSGFSTISPVSIGHEGKSSTGNNPRHNSLVAMSAGHFIAYGDLPALAM